MSTTATNTNYIYKIAPAKPAIPVDSDTKLPAGWNLPVSDLDRTSGFMHLSTVAQVPGTLKYFFISTAENRDSIYLLKVPLDPLQKRGMIRWESPDARECGKRDDEGMFPHIYDEGKFRMGRDEVESVVEVVSDEGVDGWEAALEKLTSCGWFV